MKKKHTIAMLIQITQFIRSLFSARPECSTKCNGVECIEGLFLLISAPFDTFLQSKNTQGERKRISNVRLKYIISILVFTSLNSMEKEQEKGPMNADWFYETNQQFEEGNYWHQLQKWDFAAESYEKLLKNNDKFKVNNKDTINKAVQDFQKYITKKVYNYNMTQLNLAACLMAQRKSTQHWASFDALLYIPESQRISNNEILAFNDKKKIILVRTDHVGIGDIFCFLSAAHELKKRTNWNIILSVPHFLKQTLTCAATEYGFDIISANDTPPITDYETHLIGLLGHLELTPAQMNPRKVVFTATERAINVILKELAPHFQAEKIIVVADRGEVGRQATLMGGKQLPHNSNHHGRHLNSKPFRKLIKKYPTLTLLDCSNKNNRIKIYTHQQNQYIIIPEEEQPFDTVIALARTMSHFKNIIGFGPDMGQTNVFIRALDDDAQDRMALIIPNSKEHDMRMEGEGSKYKHMISNCWVYKCKEPSEQTKVIEEAYNDMLKY